MPGVTRRQQQTLDIWPGFVDALAALLIIIIFLLLVFTLAQFFLNEVLSGRDKALERANRQLNELSEILAMERSENTKTKTELANLVTELKASNSMRERLGNQLAELLPQKMELETLLSKKTHDNEKLEKKFKELESNSAITKAELKEAMKLVSVGEKNIQSHLATIVQLKRDINTLKLVRARLESKVSNLQLSAKNQDKKLAAIRDRSKVLETRLASAEEKTILAQKEIENKNLSIKQLADQAKRIGNDLLMQQRTNADSQNLIKILNQQILAFRQQLARLNTALEASEADSTAKNIEIISLGKRLNNALASKVAELARYRSEFFGRLRKSLGQHRGIRVVGDRFVFQSEVLFPSASADLNSGGRKQIEKLAYTLNEIAARIPTDLNWILRVDGHTDRMPIRTNRFPSNWELSSARAIAVVKELISQGVKANKIVAAGFGEYQPLDLRNDEVAYRRNRRIEFKLTQR
tara:strand:- start:1160 stop:2563 length:1404 start_codon:yes stop_codon:yes gene_type:complete